MRGWAKIFVFMKLVAPHKNKDFRYSSLVYESQSNAESTKKQETPARRLGLDRGNAGKHGTEDARG